MECPEHVFVGDVPFLFFLLGFIPAWRGLYDN